MTDPTTPDDEPSEPLTDDELARILTDYRAAIAASPWPEGVTVEAKHAENSDWGGMSLAKLTTVVAGTWPETPERDVVSDLLSDLVDSLDVDRATANLVAYLDGE
jgi:hypothetical protein